jgi:hypothetical protein
MQKSAHADGENWSESMRRSLACFGLIVMSAICGCSNDSAGSAASSGGWKDFEPEQAKFSIKMPGEPAPLPKPDPSISNIWGSTAGSLSYSIRYTDLFDPSVTQNQDKIEQIYDDIYNSISLTDGLDNRDQKRQNFGGVAGREIDGTTTDKKATRIRIGIAGGRLYRADVTGPKEAVDTPDAEAFFNSFKVGR